MTEPDSGHSGGQELLALHWHLNQRSLRLWRRKGWDVFPKGKLNKIKKNAGRLILHMPLVFATKDRPGPCFAARREAHWWCRVVSSCCVSASGAGLSTAPTSNRQARQGHAEMQEPDIKVWLTCLAEGGSTVSDDIRRVCSVGATHSMGRALAVRCSKSSKLRTRWRLWMTLDDERLYVKAVEVVEVAEAVEAVAVWAAGETWRAT